MRRLCASAVVLLLIALLPCSLTADDAPLHFAGVVLYPDGSPAAGAKVWLTAWQPGGAQVFAETVADGNGSFSLAQPEAYLPEDPPLTVCTWAPPYALAWTPYLRSSDEALRIIPEPAVPIEGLILDAEGRPLVGVRPTLEHITRLAHFDPESIGDLFCSLPFPSALQAMVVSETDADGRFVIRAIPTGVQVTVSAETPDSARCRVRIESPSPPNSKPIELRLAKGGTISGRVYHGKTGKPLAGATVAVTEASDITATTDQRGEYKITGLPESTYSVYLHEEPVEFTVAVVENIVVRAGQAVDGVDVEVDPGLEIRGTLTEKGTGEPVEGALICCNTQQQPNVGRAWPLARTGPDGAYSIRAPEGYTQIRPFSMPPGWSSETSGPGSVTFVLAEANAPYTVDFQASRCRRVRGRVLDADGRPAAGARVLCWDGGGWPFAVGARADEQGCFVYLLKPAEQRVLQAYRGDDMTLTPTIIPGESEDEVVLHLSRDARPYVKGRVVDAEGAPVAGALVRAGFGTQAGVVFQGPVWQYATHTNTDVDGRFLLRSCWPGIAFETRVRAPGYAETARTREPLAEGAVIDLGDTVLEVADLAVSGVVVDEGEHPVPNASVEVEVLSGPRLSGRLGAQTDINGRFWIAGLPRRQFRVCADQFKYDSVPVVFGPDAPQGDITIRAMSRNDQIVFAHVPPNPLVFENDVIRATLSQIYRFKAFDGGEIREYLGIGLKHQFHVDNVERLDAWVYDDQGRELLQHAVRSRPEDRWRYAFSLPEDGVKTLGRIVLGPRHPNRTRVPVATFTRMHVFDPVVSGQHIAVLQSAELADESIEPKESGKAQPGKGPYIRARVYLACDETTRYRVTSAQTDAGIDLHEAWSFDYRDGTTELDLPDALKPMEAELLEEARSALRLLPQLAPGGRTIESVQCLVLQSLGDHEQPDVPKWLLVTADPLAMPGPLTAVFENIPIPPELTRAVEME